MEPRWSALVAVTTALLLGPVAHSGVNSAGQLQIRLVSLTDLDTPAASRGRCCQSPNSIDDATCDQPCRTVVRLCAAASGAGISQRPSVRFSRISALRSGRGRRSPVAVSQQYTDTAVPSGLPPVGEEDELLPVEHRSAQQEEPSGGTSIQVIHHLISSADDESQESTESISPSEDSVARPRPRDESPRPREESGGVGESAESAGAPGTATNTTGDTTSSGPPLPGSALVGRPQEPPVDQHDIGLVFVEDDDLIHLYFQPKRTRTRRRVGRPGVRTVARDGELPIGTIERSGRQARAGLTDTVGDSHFDGPDDTADRVDGSEDSIELGEGSGSEESEQSPTEESEEGPALEVAHSRRTGDVGTPRRTSECPLGTAFVTVSADDAETLPPISLPFDTPWPGRLRLAVEVWSDFTGDLDLPVTDTSHLSLARLAGRATLRTALKPGAWSSEVITAGTSQLEVQTRVLCSPGSDREHCATQCDRAVGSGGHWRCLEDGSAVCKDGWQGTHCDRPVCLSGCSPTTGYCRVPGECLCKVGYHGELCDQCVPLPGCRNGFCRRSFECRCKDGWTGLFCDKRTCNRLINAVLTLSYLH
ncbi:Delta-like protein C [Amphibalanus amphitrite]|uniref:Delta-like protein n=1 Tax=Amphibalanus amphitrite TaxID=1232801 RepID=A0A6A4VT93_AMPAM|nr:Delta-like protein C [Amphibalanus amphitrite]